MGFACLLGASREPLWWRTALTGHLEGGSSGAGSSLLHPTAAPPFWGESSRQDGRRGLAAVWTLGSQHFRLGAWGSHLPQQPLTRGPQPLADPPRAGPPRGLPADPRTRRRGSACRGPENTPQGPRAPGWLRQLSIRILTSAQVMISGFVGSGPTSGSVPTLWSQVEILSLRPCPAHVLSLSLSLSLSK